MTSLLAGPALVASPRHRLVPGAADSEGGLAGDLSAGYGLRPFAWQQAALIDLMGVRPDGKWAASRAGLSVPRQNGKNGVAEMWELWLTSQLGMRILHSAHEVKALDVDTPVFSEQGWKTMGALVTGDRVYGPDGVLTNVIAHPIRRNRPCYRLRFDDGQEVIADEDHLWGVTHVVGTRQTYRVLATRDILREGLTVTSARAGRDRRTYSFRVQLTQPLQLPAVSLDISPWLLGAWLGDGTSAKGELTVGREDLDWVLGKLTSLGERYRVRPDKRWPDRVFTVIVDGLKGRLANLGVLNGKRIPDVYFRSSLPQRRALLAGLMDTDGSSSGGQAVIGMMNEDLVRQITCLVRSLGYKASQHKVTARIDGVDKGICHRVQFRVNADTSPFALPRKTDRLPLAQKSSTRAAYNSIVAVEAVESRDTRCITVDNESRLYLVGEGFVPTHNTARKAFKRLLGFYDNPRQFPELSELVREVRRTNGQEAVELHNGGSVEFIARTKSSGRGYSADVLLLDEAQELTDEELEAIQPTISASANPQTFLMGTPPADGKPAAVWRRYRAAGVAGTDPKLCWVEYGAGSQDDPADRGVQARSNPGAPESIGWETIDDEHEGMSAAGFGRERLGIWSEGADDGGLISMDLWASLHAPGATIAGPVTWAVEVAEDRSCAVIAAAGTGAGGVVVDVVDYRPGAAWVAARMAELTGRHVTSAVLLRPGGPAGALLPELVQAGVRVESVGQQEYAQACGKLYDLVTSVPPGVRHLDQGALNTSVAGARKRSSGDAFTWDMRRTLDISPLVAVSLAAWAASRRPTYSVGSF